MDKQYVYIGVAAFFIILIFILWRVKIVFDLFRTIMNDTLKTPEGKWSKTNMITASAWFSVLFVFFADFYKHGFNQWAFGLMCSIAVGAKVMKSWANKIDPLVQPNTTTNNSPQV